MEEAVDDKFAAERFGSRKTPLFKPSTYKLFDYMGDDWSAYAPIYDLKTEATPKQRQRLMEFARLVTSASDQEFAEQVRGPDERPAALARAHQCVAKPTRSSNLESSSGLVSVIATPLRMPLSESSSLGYAVIKITGRSLKRGTA